MKENVILMPLRSCHFVADKTLSAKLISLGNYYIPWQHRGIYLNKIDDFCKSFISIFSMSAP